MPSSIDDFNWDLRYSYGGNDIHVLRNGVNSGSLDEAVYLVDSAAGETFSVADAKANPLDSDFHSVEYTPSFTHVGGAGNNISVNPSTGVINATSVSGNSVKNFLITVKVKIGTGSGTLLNKEIKIVVHVHTGITTAYLTPNPFVIRKDNDEQRFSVFAQFDDDTIGDISNHPGITWAPASGSTSDLTVDATTGKITALTSAVGKSGLKVEATLPANLGGTTISGDLTVEPSWIGNPLIARKIGGNPRDADIDNTLNFLFLSDGYLQSKEGKFQKMSKGVANRLRQSATTRPWDLLSKTKINYWTTFIPSQSSGLTPMMEVVFLDWPVSPIYDSANNVQNYSSGAMKTNNALRALPLWRFIRSMDGYLAKQIPYILPGNKYFLERNSALGSGKLNLSELVAKVGLPIQADNPSTGSPPTKAAKIAEWQSLYSGVVAADIEDEVYELWLMMANRRLMNERNSALGLAFGYKPNWEIGRFSETALSWHPLRGTRDHLDGLLTNIQDKKGNPIQTIGGDSIWGKNAGVRGKDYNTVFAVVGGIPSSGSRTPGLENGDFFTELIAGSVNENVEFEFSNVTGTRQVEYVSITDSGIVNSEIQGLFAHETAHNFTLEDEYGRINSAAIPAGSYMQARTGNNIQLKVDLLDSGNIMGDKIKWRWLRIKASSILTAAITENSGVYTLTLPEKQNSRFKVNDKIFVRKQGLYDATGASQTPSTHYSPLLKVTNIPDKTHLEVEVDGSGTFSFGTFPNGSLVMLPISRSTTGYEELLSEPIKDRINNSHKPLTNTPCQASVDKVQFPVQLSESPALTLSQPKKDKLMKVVGLYEGGFAYSCEVYHPTGMSIMRDATPKDTLNSFCPVSSYILVEIIDPQWHGRIDEDYDKYYAKL